MRNCLQCLAAQPVCKHMLCSSTSPRCPAPLQLPRARPLKAALLFQPLPSYTYVGDGVSVELRDGFNPFQLCDQLVVTLHLHNSLVEDRSSHVIAGDHLDPCILSFPCCSRGGLQSQLSWARVCHVISAPPTYCTLLQQPPLG